jgi:hypothetical protein
MSPLELFEYTLKLNLPFPITGNWFQVIITVLFVVLDLAWCGANPARIAQLITPLKSSFSPKIYAFFLCH